MQDWPEFIKKHFANDVPFIKFMGIEVTETAPGRARIHMPVRDCHANSYGIAHGGVCAALVDTVIGIALRTLKYKVVTIETNTVYYAAVKVGDGLCAEGFTVMAGRKILHANAEVRMGDGRLAAGGKAIYFVTGEDDGVYK
jgi:acyl-CoA thioesterase